MSQPSTEVFESEARAFLDANAKPLPPASDFVWGVGSDSIGSWEDKSSDEEMAEVDAAKQWKRLEFDAGFGWLMGPAEYGGRGLTAGHERVYRELRSSYDVPSLSCFTISLGMVAATIMACGNDVTRGAYVRKLYRGDLIGCQLFSEPGAGSDLAGLSTRAERDGDEWVINGQKVWTSGAQYSDIGEVLCRSNPEVPKHDGLTAFVVDMRAPGVEVRPLRQMTGGASFNEVFFNDVRIPDDHRLGEVDGGWSVAITTLMNERSLGSGRDVFGTERAMDRLLHTVKQLGLGTDPVVRQQVADCFAHVKAVEFTGMRADGRRKLGLRPGPEESIFKLSHTNTQRRIAAAISHVLGPRLMADTGEWGTYCWAGFLLGGPGGRIAAGTDEIMRNILGERVLGLPKEPGPR